MFTLIKKYMTVAKKAVKKVVIAKNEDTTYQVEEAVTAPLVEVEFFEGKKVVSSEIVGNFRDITVEGGITYRVDHK